MYYNMENNTKDEITWFWNKNANKTESDLETGEKSDEKPSLDKALPKIEEVVSMQNILKKISWNQEKEDRLQDSYQKKSVSILRRRKKSVQELEKETSKIYNITALWQRNCDLALISNTSYSKKLAHSLNASIVNTLNQVIFLSRILFGSIPPKS